MKTTVSLPGGLYRAAEREARRTRKSQSQLYAEAIAEYLAHHAPDAVADAMNRVAEMCESSDPFVAAAARKTLEQVEW